MYGEVTFHVKGLPVILRIDGDHLMIQKSDQRSFEAVDVPDAYRRDLLKLLDLVELAGSNAIRSLDD